MFKMFIRSALILCLASWSASAAAQQQASQQVSLTINNGLVTLKATNATVRQILAEWERVGGTKVVNGEKITGQPVTLTLVAQPEGQALETVLRSAAGYMVSERANPAPNTSRYDRIMLMARTTPVTATPASTAASNQNAYTANGPVPPGGNLTAEGPVTADDDEPPQPAAPVVNPYAQAAQQGGQQPNTATGAPGAISNNGVPGMGTGLGQQQQQGAQPNPGYNSIASTPNATPEKFDYANPQKYFQQQQQLQQQQQAMQPYPGTAMSNTGTNANTNSSSSTPPNAGTGAPGAVNPVQPTQQQPGNINPYSPNFNPYNLPAGTPQQSTPVTPDRAKYANPYSQQSQPPQQ